MQDLNRKNKQGFTIIEVVLVLAIAGLIFLMVFIALPQLQKSQRDTQRRNDMARLATAITQYQTNNNGKVPQYGSGKYCEKTDVSNLNPSTYNGSNGVCKFIAQYLNSSSSTTNEFVDPNGAKYAVFFNDTKSNETKISIAADNTNMIVKFHSKCGEGEGGLEYVNTPRSFAIFYRLEGAGMSCVDNQ